MPESQKSSFKAVLFDLDGTLVEFKFKVKESRMALIEWLTRNGFDTTRFSPETKTQEIYSEAKRQSESDRKLPKFDSVKESLNTILEGFEFESLKEAKPHPGSLHLLKRLRNEQVMTALVTNNSRAPVDSVLNAYGFLPYLLLIITRNEIEQMKPEPEGILKAINRLGVSREESIYVGDSVIDIQAAKRANVISVALAQGMYSGNILAKEEPDYLISKIEEVEDIVFSKSD